MSGGELALPLLMAACATPCFLSRHVMLKIYTDDGKRRMKERLSKDYATLEERNVVPGFKFEKQFPVQVQLQVREVLRCLRLRVGPVVD